MASVLTYPNVVADSATMSRDEWLAARRLGIGGSDAAAIIGVSRWSSPYSLWLNKTAMEPIVQKENEAMRFGTMMEPVIRDTFADSTQMQVVDDTNLYSHPEHEWMLANLDGVISTKSNGEFDAVLEVKTARTAWDNGVPAYYVSQVQHYMAVTNLQMTYVAALFGGEEFAWFEVPRDDRYIDDLINAEAEFWESVKKAIQPDIDGSDATYKAIRSKYESERGKTVELGKDISDLIVWRKNAKELVDQYEAEVREAESKIMEALQDAEVGTIDGKSVVTWKSQSRTSVDNKALKDAYPDLAEQFTKSSSFRVLRIK
jgi:putative phage-type endonuclease